MLMNAHGVMRAACHCGTEAGLTHTRSNTHSLACTTVCHSTIEACCLWSYVVHQFFLFSTPLRTLSMLTHTRCAIEFFMGMLLSSIAKIHPSSRQTHTHTLIPLWDSPASWIHILVPLFPRLVKKMRKTKSFVPDSL